VEAAEPRGQGPREDAEARPPLLQVHRLHRHLWPVQAIREPRLHCSLGGRQEGRQGQTGQYFYVFKLFSVSGFFYVQSMKQVPDWKTSYLQIIFPFLLLLYYVNVIIYLFCSF
jgi:hypothetical protein